MIATSGFVLLSAIFAASSSNGEINIDMDMLSKDWPLFLSNYCGRMCQNGELVTTSRCVYPECFPCDCDDNCFHKGTCCPTVDINNEKGSYAMNKSYQNSYLDDIRDRVECIHPPFHSLTILTVVRCPDTWTDKDTQEKCEKPDVESLDTAAPFTDHNSGLVFRNIFCVRCHGMYPDSIYFGHGYNATGHDEMTKSRTLQAWPLRIDCSTYKDIFHLTDHFDIYKKARGLGECSLSFDVTENITQCPSGVNRATPTCLSDTIEPLRALCHTLPAIPALTVMNSKNIFCSLCSGSKPSERNSCGNLMGAPPLIHGSLPVTLFPFEEYRSQDGGKGDDEGLGCSSDQWENDEGKCISPSCPDGKFALNGDTCQSVIKGIRGLRYKAVMKLVSQTDVLTIVLHSVARDWLEIIKDARPPHQVSFDFWLPPGCGDIGTSDTIDMTLYFHDTSSTSRDAFETELIAFLTNNVWNITTISNEVITIHTACLGATLCDFYDEKAKPVICSKPGLGFGLGESAVNDGGLVTLDVTPSLTCPSVTMNLTEEPVVVNKTITFTMALRNQEIRLSWDSNISYVDDEFRICLSLLRDIVNQFGKNSMHHFPISKNVLSSINFYLDIVCMTVSCLCLLASILTYLIFPSLLSIAGFNNLCLCLSLLTAQVSLMVTSLLGTRGHLTKIHCLIHAMILHYSWVATFAWMNTCCVHMFRVFKGQSLGSQSRAFLWYCLYSFGFPFLVVVTVMTLSTIVTRGRSIGYDPDICFLDVKISSLILILGLGTPFSLLILVNLLTFIMTTKDMLKLTETQQQQQKQQPITYWDIVPYVKLFAVTVTFCTFRAAAVQLESPILSMISSPFAALAGVFIFTSFVTNKRVLKISTAVIFRHRTKNSFCHSFDK